VPEVLLLWHPRLRFSQKIGCALYKCLENGERGCKDKDGAHTVGKTRAVAVGHALVPILGKEQGEHNEKTAHSDVSSPPTSLTLVHSGLRVGRFVLPMQYLHNVETRKRYLIPNLRKELA
jgi:hypothetical protein